jgi:hypothetical protein
MWTCTRSPLQEPFYLNRLVLSEMETDAQARFTAGRREAAHSAYLRSVFNVTALRRGMVRIPVCSLLSLR